MIHFQSNNESKQMSVKPELDYFMNESVSDVVFVVEDQQIPALKAILCLKSTVFRELLSSKPNDSKKESIVVIEDTTYAAFKTFLPHRPEPIEKKLGHVFHKHLFELKKHSYVFIKMVDIFY